MSKKRMGEYPYHTSRCTYDIGIRMGMDVWILRRVRNRGIILYLDSRAQDGAPMITIEVRLEVILLATLLFGFMMGMMLS